MLLFFAIFLSGLLLALLLHPHGHRFETFFGQKSIASVPNYLFPAVPKNILPIFVAPVDGNSDDLLQRLIVNDLTIAFQKQGLNDQVRVVPLASTAWLAGRAESYRQAYEARFQTDPALLITTEILAEMIYPQLILGGSPEIADRRILLESFAEKSVPAQIPPELTAYPLTLVSVALGLGAFRQKNFSRAIDFLEQGLAGKQISPGNQAEIVCYAGRAYYERYLLDKHADDFTRAESLFQRLLPGYPQEWLIRNYLGALYMSAGRYREARRELQQGMQLNPRSSEIYANFGRLDWLEGFSAEAESKLQEAFSLAPTNFKICYNLAYMQENVGKLEEALRQYLDCLKLDANSYTLYTNIGFLCTRLKRYDEAIAALKTAVRLNSGYNTGYYNLACVYALKGEGDLALHWLEKALILGYKKIDLIKTDPELASIRNTAKFQHLIARFQ
jgi:Flp pilus assembly protein TadD